MDKYDPPKWERPPGVLAAQSIFDIQYSVTVPKNLSLTTKDVNRRIINENRPRSGLIPRQAARQVSEKIKNIAYLESIIEELFGFSWCFRRVNVGYFPTLDWFLVQLITWEASSSTNSPYCLFSLIFNKCCKVFCESTNVVTLMRDFPQVLSRSFWFHDPSSSSFIFFMDYGRSFW